MLREPSDLHIRACWTAPMRGDGGLLERHTLVIRDGKILALLPDIEADERFAPRVTLQRATHLLMPGLVNAHTGIGSLIGDTGERRFDADRALLAIARMLKGGITTFCNVSHFPDETARAAAAQGMRAMIGLPLDARPSAWAETHEYLTRALRLRDEYKGHPSISTAFAPIDVPALEDAALERLGTLAAELDAGVLASLRGSLHDLETALARLERLGLLTPALVLSHAGRLDAEQLGRVRRSGLGLVLCPSAGLSSGDGLPALGALQGLRTGVGTDGAGRESAQDLWSEIRLLALESGDSVGALAAATRGGAAALGLDAEIGAFEPGTWADACCLDLSMPATYPAADPLEQVALGGGRDLVSDVWVAGRHLVSDGAFTRLDWSGLAARLKGKS